MSPQTVPAGLQLRSLVKPDGELELSLIRIDTPRRGADPVEATPINPSDIGLLFGAADLATVHVSPARPTGRWSTRPCPRALP
jgi:NADPH2:quinone reductase